MRTRADRLQALCGILYQAAGAFDMPERILDVLAKAKNEGDIAEADLDGLLPCMPPQPAEQIPWGGYPWAKWAAVEPNGALSLHANRPFPVPTGWYQRGTAFTIEDWSFDRWTESLRKRPEGV